MASLTIEVPEPLMAALDAHHMSDEQVASIVTRALEDWLDQQHRSTTEPDPGSPFTESAVDFTDQVIAENPALFEELARI